MRRPIATAALLLCVPALAWAQPATPPASPAAPPATPPAAASDPAPPAAADATAPEPKPDMVIAKVGDTELHYADLLEAVQNLPDQLRQLPPNMLYPMLLDQLIDRQVVVAEARKEKLGDDPKVQAAIQRASNAVLQNALLTREIQPMLTPEAIQARYDKDYANKPGEDEVRAAHILVPTEEKAKDIIAQLAKGADFAELAKANSTDPSAKQNSGELGWFKKTDMLPEFSDAAFAQKDGQITQTPVQTRFGWHVIKTEEHRTAPPPSLDEVRDQIRQSIIQEGVAKVLASAKQGMSIAKFNLDGTPMQDPPAGAPAGAPTPDAPAPGK